MTESFPSRRIITLKAPETQEIQGEFIYNFFVPDEKENDSGIVPNEIAQNVGTGNFNTKLVDDPNFKRSVPRANKITWKPITNVQNPVDVPSIKVSNNINKIHYETDFHANEFSKYLVQDIGINEKLKLIARSALETFQNRNENTASIDNKSPRSFTENLDGNSKSNENISDEIFRDFASDLDKRGWKFTQGKKKKKPKTSLDDIKNVNIQTRINDKFIHDLALSRQENPVNIFQNKTNDLVRRSKQIAQQSTSKKPSTTLKGEDYDINIVDVVNTTAVDSDSYKNEIRTIGYIVEKFELQNDNTLTQQDSLIVDSPTISTTLDFSVRYGSRYIYKIRTVALAELQVQDTDTDSIVNVQFLVASEPSSPIIVETEETIPPPPPSDFRLHWDKKNENLVLLWSFPNEPQLDIKKFQVFRRSSIEEPFQLLKQYDFDDSTIKTPQQENVRSDLNERMPGSPKAFYVDNEFTKDSKFIYALCCVDAHGFSSTYSIQYEAAFDKFKNKLMFKVISPKGAPKTLPNAFLEDDPFVNSIKDSNHDKMRIVFNPEQLDVVDENGFSQNLLNLGNDSKYKVQLINVDLQQQQDVDIHIDDKRN